jgi:hypothetical protein
MQTNTGEATRFLNFIFRNCPDGSRNINIRSKNSNGDVRSIFISVDHIEEIPALLTDDSDWWSGIALRNGDDGTKGEISLIPALHLDHIGWIWNRHLSLLLDQVDSFCWHERR